MTSRTVAGALATLALAGGAEAAAAERTLVFLEGRDRAGLERVAAAVSDPRSPRYGRRLSAAQVRERFAPPASAVDAVRAFAEARGLRVTAVARNRAYVELAGRVPRLPRSLAAQVLAVRRLDAPYELRPAADPAPAAGQALRPGPCARFWSELVAEDAPAAYGRHHPRELCGYTPAELRSAYGVDGAVAAGIDGRGQAIAILGIHVSPTLAQDVDEYSRRHGLPPVELEIVAPQADNSSGDEELPALYGEQTLDIEAVHAIAPAARIVYVGVNQSPADRLLFDKAIADLVGDDRVQAVSVSFAAGETRDPGLADSEAQLFLQAHAQGIGLYAASGDTGEESSSGRFPSYPASSPYFTGVGGTTLAIGPAGGRSFEVPWGTRASELEGGAWSPAPPGDYVGGGGGGTSGFYAQPDYQRGVVPPQIADRHAAREEPEGFWQVPGRAVPDLAAVGDPLTGFVTGQTLRHPDGADRYTEYRQAGSSLATPVVAALALLADQAAGRRHGFLNPALYALHRTPAFHDVLAPAEPPVIVRRDFVNGVDASGGIRTTLNTGSQLGTLLSLPGYDDSTGLGTPNGLAFLRALAPDSAALSRLEERGPAPPAAPGAAPACARFVTVALPRRRGRRIVRVAVRLDGRLVKVRRGRALRSVRLRRPTLRRAQTLTLRARTARGGRLTVRRRLAAC